MTSGFSMQAMTRSVPPHLGQVSIGGHRKNNQPKRAWRQVRLNVEGLEWSLRVRAQVERSMVAKGCHRREAILAESCTISLQS